jgi:hypothetical protein
VSDTSEMILPDSATKEVLKALLDAAYLNVSLDSDGDIEVNDTYRYWVIPAQNGKWIRLFAQFKGNPDASMATKLEFANVVNRDLHIIRAYLRDTGGFTFDRYIPVEGGVSRRAIVFAVREFDDLLQAALKLDEMNAVG